MVMDDTNDELGIIGSRAWKTKHDFFQDSRIPRHASSRVTKNMISCGTTPTQFNQSDTEYHSLEAERIAPDQVDNRPLTYQHDATYVIKN